MAAAIPVLALGALVNLISLAGVLPGVEEAAQQCAALLVDSHSGQPCTALHTCPI